MTDEERLDYMKKALAHKVVGIRTIKEFKALDARLKNGEAKTVILEEIRANRDRFDAAAAEIEKEA